VEDEGRCDELGELTASFNAMAESLEKSEEKRREFIANVSHELKTPMTTIAGFADGLLDGTIPPENQEKYLSTISAETKRLSRLVRRMLELSRLQAAEREDLQRMTFDISEVLRRTLLNFADKINARGLDVDARVPEERIDVLGDEDAVTQVVYNLLDNAVKFSRAGSVLGLSLWKQGSKAYVSVKNTGDTIPEAEIPLLFDRFHKTDRSRSRDRDGVGLGLYIVKTILNNHGEDIAVTSREGVTEFVFTLTLQKDGR
jgi:signal transduction histidine kinase